MTNPLAKLNSIQLGKPNAMTVLHHDGFTLTGSVVHAGIARLDVQASGRSRAIDPLVAVAEVVEQIREGGVRKLPARAVLVSASAIGALIELPVNPSVPRPPAQLQEMVRWELEPLFAQQAERWSIGSLLMGRGYLPAQRRAEVMTEVLSRNAASNQRLTVRFGEVASTLGLVTREQIDECLELQERLVQIDDDIVCGWAGQSAAGEEVDEESPRYRWYVSGIGDGMRRQWVKACQRQKLFLASIYPSLGAGFAGATGSGRDLLYVDVQQEEFAVLRGRPGALRALRLESAHDGLIDPLQVVGLCSEELRPDIDEVRVNAAAAAFERLRPLLEDRLERRVLHDSSASAGQEAA